MTRSRRGGAWIMVRLITTHNLGAIEYFFSFPRVLRDCAFFILDTFTKYTLDFNYINLENKIKKNVTVFSLSK